MCVCGGSGGVGKTTTSAAIALGMAARGRQGRGGHDRPGQAAGERARAAGARERAAAGGARAAVQAIDVEGELWAMMLDPKRTFDELIDRIAPDPDAGGGDQVKPRLPRALDGRLGIAGVHRGGQALRARPRRRLRPARARHAAVAQRARLPRRARQADLVPRRPGAEGVRPPHGTRHAGAGARRRPVPRSAAQGHRHRSDQRPVDVLRPARRHDRRLPRARRRGRADAQSADRPRSCS